MRDDLILEDTTLRDGEQSPGVAFDVATKLAVHAALVDAGVQWIEAGIPASGGAEREALEQMLATNQSARLVAWSRGVQDDVADALDMGFTAVHIGLPVSDVLLEHSVRRSRGWVVDRARELIDYAKRRGAFVSVSAEDVGRADRAFLLDYAAAVGAAGADRLRLSDTVGVMTPGAYGAVVRQVGEVSDVATQCHCHDDFGLGLANALAGLEAGARYCHGTINGIGERAGLPDLAHLVAALRHLYDHETGIDLLPLRRLSTLVCEAMGEPLARHHPIFGANVARHESGIHVNALLRDGSTFEPTPPEAFGATRTFVLGKHSGRAGIRAALRTQDIEATEHEVLLCLDRIRAVAGDDRGQVEASELAALVRASRG